MLSVPYPADFLCYFLNHTFVRRTMSVIKLTSISIDIVHPYCTNAAHWRLLLTYPCMLVLLLYYIIIIIIITITIIIIIRQL